MYVLVNDVDINIFVDKMQFDICQFRVCQNEICYPEYPIDVEHLLIGVFLK